MTRHRLTSTADIRAYLFGCEHSGTFTIVSNKRAPTSHSGCAAQMSIDSGTPITDTDPQRGSGVPAGRYTLLGRYEGLATFLTPYGRQPWVLCRTRKPFVCVQTGREWPEGTFAWRPAGHPKNRRERIAADGLLDTRSIASAVLGRPHQRRLAKALAQAERPMLLSRLSHRAGLNHRTADRALDALIAQGLVCVIDEADPTTDWYQGDGYPHADCVIAFA